MTQIDEIVEQLNLPENIPAKQITEYLPIKLGDKIPYTRLHQSAGWAEFSFCVKRDKLGKIIDVYVSRYQQGNEYPRDYVLHLPNDCQNLTCVYFSGQHATKPEIGDAAWCEDHECEFLRMHVPRGIEKGYLKFIISCEMLWVEFCEGD